MSTTSGNYLKQAWHARERLYKELFGPHKCSLPKIYDVPKEAEASEISSAQELTAALGKTLTEKDISILAHEPNEIHPYWTFATSGLSNPWFGQSDEVSGFGCELVLKTKNPGPWAWKLLRRLVYYIVSYSGTLSPGVMLQFDARLFREGNSELSGIIVWYVDEAPECIYQLPSGSFGIFSIIGVTADECALIETIDKYGCWCVQQIIRENGFGQLTEPKRESIMKGENIDGKINSLRNYLENFGFVPGVDSAM